MNRFEQNRPSFHTRSILLGLVAAALFALSIVIVATAAPTVIDDIVTHKVVRVRTLDQLGSLVLALVVFGAPVAIVAALAVGLPIWRLIERNGRATVFWAVLGGIACGAIIAALITAHSVLGGLSDYFDPNSFSSTGNRHGTLTYNGLLTPLGWLYEGQRLLVFAIIGAFAGWFAYRCALAVERRTRPQDQDRVGVRR